MFYFGIRLQVWKNKGASLLHFKSLKHVKQWAIIMDGFVLDQVVRETTCLHMSSTNVCYVNIPIVPGASNLELQIKPCFHPSSSSQVSFAADDHPTPSCWATSGTEQLCSGRGEGREEMLERIKYLLQSLQNYWCSCSCIMLTGRLPETGRCTPETWHCWLGRRLMIDGSNRPTMQAGVSRTAGGCERCKDEWKQESYGPRLRYSCWSLVCVSPWP